MPVQHTEDENQSSWWIIELGANLQWGCVYTKPNIQSSQPKKKKKSLVTGKIKLVDQDCADKIKWETKYNATVKDPADFTKLKENM